jgi:hypothetical protein
MTKCAACGQRIKKNDAYIGDEGTYYERLLLP